MQRISQLVYFLALVCVSTAQIQKCGYSCHLYDGLHNQYTLLAMRTASDGATLECDYSDDSLVVVDTCRYNTVDGSALPSNSANCYAATGPTCGPSHPAGTMCVSYCAGYTGTWGPQSTTLQCAPCNYDLNSGVLQSIDKYYTARCNPLAAYVVCEDEPEPLPTGWSVAVQCAMDSTGDASNVLPNNVAIPLNQVGDGIEILTSSCIEHCAGMGYSYAAVENAATCYCSSSLASNVISVDPAQCQTRCASPTYNNNWSCGGVQRLQVYKQ